MKPNNISEKSRESWIKAAYPSPAQGTSLSEKEFARAYRNAWLTPQELEAAYYPSDEYAEQAKYYYHESDTEMARDVDGTCRHIITVKLLVNHKLAQEASGQYCIRQFFTAHRNPGKEVCSDAQRHAEQIMKEELIRIPWKMEYHPIPSLRRLLDSMI